MTNPRGTARTSSAARATGPTRRTTSSTRWKSGRPAGTRRITTTCSSSATARPAFPRAACPIRSSVRTTAWSSSSWRCGSGICRSRLRSHDADRVECGSEHRLRGDVEPILQDCRVNATEVGGELEVVLVEVGEAGVLADEAGLDAGAGDEHGGGCAVVGSLTGVLADPAAELAEGHREHPAAVAVLVEIADEG